ncbi:hypothetical protein KRE43_05520 [Elizabethkingia meningoseptica]|uniref:hypothetical protein n=1 Tax=Elizabethkingia meningoseptica TaxID=238 RepID=UPI0023AE94E3|nr:hypothetical protein [Elizabethkingia meningoseptica]MDE5515146.1 hypothetical protein [Elizabethkingia meningoseptica]MDE5525883.1 hypothetical protein [Elizabethkingia meningoseptica]MDE5529412.1 hypothetical protein [Elizabethkingia meningoseptica]MDE5532968.1 hypothetical protein [Elizabethkingia meningoseptica]MDE5541301.1 hypothetical protein [Elizabethkingia meningoseptica]
MIDKILPLALTALGATMVTRKGNLFIESSTYSDFEPTDWMIDSIKKSEGLRENAYYATDVERSKGIVTIGYGNTALFDKNGRPFVHNGNNKVKINYTLTFLKTLMGYPSLSSEDFAVELIKNHLKQTAYSRIAKDLDSRNVPFIKELAEFLSETSYGSGLGLFNGGGVSGERSFYENLINIISATSDRNQLARACAAYRYSYYRGVTSQWNIPSVRLSWMIRIYLVSMHLKGSDITNSQIWAKIQTKNATGSRGNYRVELLNLASLYRDNLGLVVVL